MVVEVVACKPLQIAVAAAGEDVGYCGDEEGGDEQESGEDDDELQGIGHAGMEREAAGTEQETGGFD